MIMSTTMYYEFFLQDKSKGSEEKKNADSQGIIMVQVSLVADFVLLSLLVVIVVVVSSLLQGIR